MEGKRSRRMVTEVMVRLNIDMHGDKFGESNPYDGE